MPGLRGVRMAFGRRRERKHHSHTPQPRQGTLCAKLVRRVPLCRVPCVQGVLVQGALSARWADGGGADCNDDRYSGGSGVDGGGAGWCGGGGDGGDSAEELWSWLADSGPGDSINGHNSTRESINVLTLR